MRRRVVLAAIIMSTIILIASLLVLFWNENAKPPTEKLILRASDMPDTGWHDAPYGPGVPYEEGVDEFGMTFYRNSYETHSAWKATLFLVHLASNGAALAMVQTAYDAFDANITVHLGTGSEGFLFPNATTFHVSVNTTQQVDILVFSKGSFFCEIRFVWMDGYEIPISDMIGLAKAQADKLP